MAIGFVLDNVSPSENIVPDRYFVKNSTPRILQAKFGDGYEQRLPDGINNIEQTYSVSFANRTKQEIDNIIDFFDSKAGATSFSFVIPDSRLSPPERTIKVVCDNYSQTYTHFDVYSCTANFRRVYE